MNYTENEIGTVTEIQGAYAILEVKESAACAGCHAKVVCKSGQEGNRCLKLENCLNASVGDKVIFDTSESQQVLINIMQYGLPLIGFLIGLVGYFYGIADKIAIPKEIGAFISGIVLLLLFGMITRHWSEKKSKTLVLHKMVKILDDDE